MLDRAKPVTTKVSSRGQVVLPASVRTAKNCGPGTELVVVERGDEPDRAAAALDWHAAGMDFADALHLAGSSDCDELVTFDRDFALRARDVPDAIPVRLL